MTAAVRTLTQQVKVLAFGMANHKQITVKGKLWRSKVRGVISQVFSWKPNLPRPLSVNLLQGMDPVQRLHMAVANARYLDVEALLLGNCDPNGLDAIGFTPLHRALQHNLLDIAALLLDNGAMVSTIDPDEYTTLLRAIGTGNLEIVNQVLDLGADPTGPDGVGRCPPILCAWSSGGHPMEVLIQSSINMWHRRGRVTSVQAGDEINGSMPEPRGSS